MGIYGQCHEHYCFVTLTFNLKVTDGLLKVRFWPFLPMVSGWAGGRLGGQVGGGREKVCPACISETVRCRKLILGRDIG